MRNPWLVFSPALVVAGCAEEGATETSASASGAGSDTSAGAATSSGPQDDPGDDPGDGPQDGPQDGPADTTVGNGETTSSPRGSDDSTGTAGVGCDADEWVVCEDFEDAPLDGNPDGWDLRSSGVYGGNGMGTTEAQAFSGARSFQLQSGDSGAQWLTYQGDISVFDDGHWGRLYLRMSDPVPWPDRGGVIHGDIVEARGNWQGSTHQVRWAVINNAAMLHNWGYNVQTSNAGEFIHETGYIYDWTEEWLCVEWHHDQSAQNATLWIDGEMILDVTEADDPQLPTFDDISVGWANYQAADPEFVLFLDDVALHTERIGCPGG